MRFHLRNSKRQVRYSVGDAIVMAANCDNSWREGKKKIGKVDPFEEPPLARDTSGGNQRITNICMDYFVYNDAIDVLTKC